MEPTCGHPDQTGPSFPKIWSNNRGFLIWDPSHLETSRPISSSVKWTRWIVGLHELIIKAGGRVPSQRKQCVRVIITEVLEGFRAVTGADEALSTMHAGY